MTQQRGLAYCLALLVSSASVSPIGVQDSAEDLAKQLTIVGGGVRYWAKSPDSAPEGFGVRLVFTLLFPR